VTVFENKPCLNGILRFNYSAQGQMCMPTVGISLLDHLLGFGDVCLFCRQQDVEMPKLTTEVGKYEYMQN
jgi:hypothetical protein